MLFAGGRRGALPRVHCSRLAACSAGQQTSGHTLVQVDVAATNSVALEAATLTSTLDAVPPLGQRMTSAKSSPNLAGLHRKSAFSRARSVDLTYGNGLAPSAGGHTRSVDIQESFRRADTARAMSMDVSHVPGVDPSRHHRSHHGLGETPTWSSANNVELAGPDLPCHNPWKELHDASVMHCCSGWNLGVSVSALRCEPLLY